MADPITPTRGPRTSSSPPPEPKTTAQQRIDQAVLAKEPIEGVAARVQIVPASEGSIVVDIAVDAKALRYIQRDARSIQQLTFTTVLESASGEFLDGKQAVMDLELPPPARRMADTPSHPGSRGQPNRRLDIGSRSPVNLQSNPPTVLA